MNNILEIRFHGRGGQGAKTAAAFLAEAAQDTGKFIQSFPEYGAERQGAPVKAFTRISDDRITVHCGITEPNIVVVTDPTLVKSIPIADGLKEDGILIINTSENPDVIREHTGWQGRLVVINATKIAMEEIGRAITNSAMLGVLEKVWEVVPYDKMLKFTYDAFVHKLGEDLANKNINAMKRAYEEAHE